MMVRIRDRCWEIKTRRMEFGTDRIHGNSLESLTLKFRDISMLFFFFKEGHSLLVVRCSWTRSPSVSYTKLRSARKSPG